MFPSYVATVTANTSYYLSDLELVALCRCQQTSVVILLHNLDDDTMQYHSHSFSPFDNGVRWVAIETLAGGNSVRSHFEKVVLDASCGQPIDAKQIEDEMIWSSD